ncbi:aminoglycoside phosphotransferase family protein [Rhodoferax antarcticus]|uniref:Aminoglycoside phosphotransferase n=1 Tax=Rhodoferax antarcticus ANT.BR TaxID=1111071 RepID=A0A1Q8YGZ3_9BURK|nr:phosphotransferase [Rhodoferax antarcticus]APW45325.1 aminoglycoside phosphotransferase [Rhodoferax antarcticus]OLP07189.1 aminoglycoside phosphotransferase [Rhodoferax antarcticus ANT.BR]
MSHAPPYPTLTPGVPSAASDITWTDPQRGLLFDQWLAATAPAHGLRTGTLRLASADASFRRYFRVDTPASSRIIMDAPPQQENCQPFVKVAQLMHDAGLCAPGVLAWDEPLGFLLLSDLGGQTMLQVIDKSNPQANLPLYLQAVDALIAWQLASKPDVLPPYDEALLRRELELFPDWYLVQDKGLTIDETMRFTLDNAFKQIIAVNLAQPSVYVHRDFMPRNLMAPTTPGGALGVLDFQDAVYGPITYDIASLMRDAFLSWDEDFCLDVTVRYWEKARKAGLPVGDDFGEFYRGVEWMGLQRHLKVVGIFARLTLRDAKPQYLADTPRFITYIRSTCARYRELKPLLRLVDKAEGIVEPDIFGFGRQA